jgi:hypothetical protein
VILPPLVFPAATYPKCGGTVAQHSPRHPTVKGLIPVTNVKGEKMKMITLAYLLGAALTKRLQATPKLTYL